MRRRTPTRMRRRSEYVLVVEDDRRQAAEVADYFRAHQWTTRLAHSVATGLAAVREGAPAAAVIDLMLPDGTGLDVVRAIRDQAPVPVMVLTNYPNPEIVNRIHALGAEYVLKIDSRPNLELFASRISDSAPRRAAAFAKQHGLSVRETDVLTLAVTDISREELAKRLGITLDTAKSHARKILQKTGRTRMADLARELRGPKK